MKDSKHTPLPWALADNDPAGHPWPEGRRITAWGSNVVALATDDVRRFNIVVHRDCLANAEFIVRAVNSHNKLLAASKAAINELDRLVNIVSEEHAESIGRTCGVLCAAIRQAEGKV